MRSFNIAVNGVCYAVEVEELKGIETHKSPPQPNIQPVRPKPEPMGQKPPALAPREMGRGGKTITAPMPGTILSVKVSSGMAVSQGDTLAVLEAMKMENEIIAHTGGIVKSVLVTSGSLVQAGEAIVIMD